MMKWIFFITMLFKSGLVISQNASVQEQGVSQNEFEEVVEGLSYTKTKKALRPRPPKERTRKEKKEHSWNFGNSLLNAFSFLEILAYGVVIFLISYILFVIFSNVKINNSALDSEIILTEEEEDIEELDLDSELIKALKVKDYRLAVRLRFLGVLQLLSREGYIKWKPEKTNRDYTREIRSKYFFKQFKELARLFEIIWYGNTDISSEQYDEIALVFDGFKTGPNE